MDDVINEEKVIAVGFNRFPLSRIVTIQGYISNRIIRRPNGDAHLSMDYQPKDAITGLAITIYMDTTSERNEFMLCLEEAEEFLEKYDEITGVTAQRKARLNND